MTKPNVVYLMQTHFSQRDYQRFGVENCIGRGYPTEIWVLVHVLNPDYARIVMEPEVDADCPIRKFRSLDDVLSAINQLPMNSFVINELPYGFKTKKIYAALVQNKIRSIFLSLGALPLACPSLAEKVWTKLEMMTFERFIDYVYRFLFPRNGMLYQPIQVLSGNYGHSDDRNKNTTIEAHSFDYDVFLDHPATDAVEPTAVFLDEYLPYHPDYRWMGIRPYSEPSTYFRQLNTFFDWIEESLQLQIVIAAHPRAEYDKHPGIFKHRTVLQGNTAKLIRTCSLTIGHFSTANSFAALYGKPVTFISSHSMAAHYGKHIESMASWFNKPVLYMDDRKTWGNAESLLSVDRDAYTKYITNFIKTPGSPDRKIWDIIFDRLEAFYSQYAEIKEI